MHRLRQQLKVVHDELTHLMAEAKLDSLSRSKLASASNRLLDISQQLDSEIAKPNADPQARSSIIKKAMVFLAWWGNLLKGVITMWRDEDGS